MIRYEKMSQFTSQEKEKMEEYKLKKFNKCLAVAKNIKDSVYVISFLQQQFKLGIGSTHTHTHTHKHFKNG
jgi:hypothetical protein